MEYLTLLALGNQEQSLITELSKLASLSQCSIEIGHATLMGTETCVCFLFAGEWSGIAKIEALLPTLEKRLNLALICKRATAAPTKQDLLPYTAHAVGLDQPTIVHEICHFFVSQKIPVIDLQTSANQSKQTGTRIFNLALNIGIPADLSIADLRERFMMLCDDLNIDGILEPDRR